MNISEIKSTTGQTTLAFQRQFLEDKITKTEWLAHWDNDKRIRVIAHEDVIQKMKDNPEMKELALKREEITPSEGDKKPYTRFVIITPNNIEASF